jgi:hypothetical protein
MVFLHGSVSIEVMPRTLYWRFVMTDVQTGYEIESHNGGFWGHLGHIWK